MCAHARPMTAAEKYYAFLDATWPMNLVLVAELDRVWPPAVIEEHWRTFSAARVFTRMRATTDLTIVDGGNAVDFAADEVSTLADALAAEAPVPHGLERPLLCRYWTAGDRTVSWVALIGHHSIVDARGGVSELQEFVRFLAGASLSPQRELSVPEPPGRHAWLEDRQQLLALLRELGAENQSMGAPEPADWADRSLPRRPRFADLELDRAHAGDLLGAAATKGTRIFAALAAAAMTAVAREVCERPDAVLQLNVPTDLTLSRDDPGRPAPMKVAVLSHRHHVRVDDPWRTARAVDDALRRARERGEGELFFHLARVDRADTFERGVRVVADGVASAPPAVSVTNLGVVDAAADPPWLRRVAAFQAPTPNQIISSIGLGYRDRQVISMATDDARIGPDEARQLLSSYAATLTAMASNGDVD